MQVPTLENWPLNASDAKKNQLELRAKAEQHDRLPEIRTVAGTDVAFIQPEARSWERGTGRAIGAVVLYRYPSMEELERATAVDNLTFPYVPGFLSFREIPVLLKALGMLRETPDLIFCDGQGRAHPRRIGLATHLGIVLDLPTIGCAKSRFIGTYSEPGTMAGSWSPILDDWIEPTGNEPTAMETIGAVLRTADNVRPIFVSSGHRVSLPSAIELTMSVCDGRRIPRPTRDADRVAAIGKESLIR